MFLTKMACFGSIKHCPGQHQVKKRKLDAMSFDTVYCSFFSLIKADRETHFSKPFNVSPTPFSEPYVWTWALSPISLIHVTRLSPA